MASSSSRRILQEGGDPRMQFAGGFAAGRAERQLQSRRVEKHLRRRAPESRARLNPSQRPQFCSISRASQIGICQAQRFGGLARAQQAG